VRTTATLAPDVLAALAVALAHQRPRTAEVASARAVAAPFRGQVRPHRPSTAITDAAMTGPRLATAVRLEPASGRYAALLRRMPPIAKAWSGRRRGDWFARTRRGVTGYDWRWRSLARFGCCAADSASVPSCGHSCQTSTSGRAKKPLWSLCEWHHYW